MANRDYDELTPFEQCNVRAAFGKTVTDLRNHHHAVCGDGDQAERCVDALARLTIDSRATGMKTHDEAIRNIQGRWSYTNVTDPESPDDKIKRAHKAAAIFKSLTGVSPTAYQLDQML